MKTYKAPSVDFSLQFSFSDNDRVENKIFNTLKVIAEEVSAGKKSKMGAIVVIGDFSESRSHVSGFVQMKPKQNPIKSLIMVGTNNGSVVIERYSRPPYDGAIVVDKTGQILGAGLYLVIEHPELDLPNECGTRHKSAASFSFTDGVISVLTLSEETNTIRIWKDGSAKKTLDVG